MIKLYDDQKLEVINELKKYYEQAVKNVKELKEKEEYTSFAELDKYEKANAECAEIIEKAEKDLNSISEKQWADLLAYITILNLQEEEGKERRKNFDNTNAWWGILGLIIVSAIFGGSNWSWGNTDPEDNKDLN